jgi:hypothetical protein
MRRHAIAVWCVWVLAAAAGAGAPPPPEVELIRLARTTLDNCGESCRDLAADVWAVRKRVADRVELASMAVQVEQGDEACLCGKKSPTATALDRQAQLLAEAATLFHRAGDAAGAERNLGKLRNTAHAHADNSLVLELLVRTSTLLGGAPAGVGELSTLRNDRLRVHVLTHAAAARALPTEATKAVLTEASRAYLALPTEARTGLARPLFDRLRRAGLNAEARSVADTSPERDAWLELLSQPLSTTAAAPIPDAVRVALTPLEGPKPDLRAAAAKLATLEGPAAPFLHESAGRAAARRDVGLALDLARQLRPAPLRLAFATGAAKQLTDDRAGWDDFLATHAMPE